MKTLLVLLLVSGLVVESSALSWESFKEALKEKYDDAGDFFSDLGRKAKDFVTGKKGEFEKLANALKGKLEKLEECEKCDDGHCSEDENVKCEERFINFEKVNDFMNCLEDKSRTDCEVNLGRGATPPPKRELSQKRVGRPATKIEEGDTAEEQRKDERRVAVLLRELLKKSIK